MRAPHCTVRANQVQINVSHLFEPDRPVLYSVGPARIPLGHHVCPDPFSIFFRKRVWVRD